MLYSLMREYRVILGRNYLLFVCVSGGLTVSPFTVSGRRWGERDEQRDCLRNCGVKEIYVLIGILFLYKM